jgi:putative restriction endonuclease
MSNGTRPAGPASLKTGSPCARYHKGLDRGAIGLAEDLTILISGNVHGQTGVAEWLLEFKGKKLRQPHSASLVPSKEFLGWHRKEVFRSPA